VGKRMPVHLHVHVSVDVWCGLAQAADAAQGMHNAPTVHQTMLRPCTTDCSIPLCARA